MNELHVFFDKWKIIKSVLLYGFVSAVFLFYLQGIIMDPSADHYRQWEYLVSGIIFGSLIFYYVFRNLFLLTRGKVGLKLDEHGIMVTSPFLFIPWHDIQGVEGSGYSYKSKIKMLVLYLYPYSEIVTSPPHFYLRIKFFIRRMIDVRPSIEIDLDCLKTEDENQHLFEFIDNHFVDPEDDTI